MLSANRQHAGRCIYCAFRARQIALQSRRSKHTGQQSNDSPVRYLEVGERGGYKLRKVINASRETRNNELEGVLSKRGGFLNINFRGNLSHSDFRDVLHGRLNEMKDELRDAPVLEQLRKEQRDYDEGQKIEGFNKLWKGFTHTLLAQEERKPFFGEAEAHPDKKRLMHDLREAFSTRGRNGLDDRIKYAFYGHVTGSRFTRSDIRNQRTLADLRYPSEWFPATRVMHRTIHLHVGPTNSGKTYHALQRLEQAESGIYAGPLRLLAHEVYTRMNARGKPCSLITGEERRAAPGHEGEEEAGVLGDMSACTVEMIPLNKNLDVAVIDEIQMIGSTERGWAWTQALLGVKAKEVHLCGEERTVPLVRALCASVGEKLEIHRYERLSPLKVADESLNGNLKALRKGDCIVSFSVMGIHALRRQIERDTGKKVATVYGSLPPETRAQQARLFNDQNNDYDFLVASDAVGMGLNLAIKRIIFESSSKFDGLRRRTLSVADIKQIAGRAGRYRVAGQAAQAPVSEQDLSAAKGDSAPPLAQQAPPSPVSNEHVGLVTTLETFDFPLISSAMTTEPEPIHSAGLFPPSPILERFASYFPPGTPFSYILTRLHELSQMHSRFHLCGLKDQVWVADLIEGIPGLTISDRNIICSSPASKTDNDLWRELMPAFARCIAEQSGGNIVDIQELPLEILEADVSPSREYLRELERLHKGLVTYLWLSYRFAGIFNTRALAFHVKGMVEEKIEWVLGQFSFSEKERRRVAARRETALLKEMAEEAVVDEEADGDAGTVRAGREFEDKDEEDEVMEDGARGRDEGSLEEQNALTSGEDRFGGEADEELGLHDDEQEHEPVGEDDAGVVVNFAQRRQREQMLHGETGSECEVEGLLESSSDMESEETPTPLSDGSVEIEEEGLTAAWKDELFEIASEERPAVEDVVEAPEVTSSVSSTGATILEQEDSAGLDEISTATPETELDEDSQPPLETQQVPPKATGSRVAEDTPQTSPHSQPAGRNQFGNTPPPKHLAHLDVPSTEVERDVGSRP